MTLFNGTYLRSFLLNQKNRRFYDLDHIIQHNNNNNNNNRYLQKFQDGLQILSVRGFQNRLKKFLKKSLMPVFMFLRICEDFSYKSSSMKSVRAAAIMFVSVARHHSKTFVQMCTAITLLDKLEV